MAIITDVALEADPTAALARADTTPLVVTEGGEPAYVLLAHSEYQRLTLRRRGTA